MYISTYEELLAFCKRAAAFDAVAIDTEFLRERTYHARLCLVLSLIHISEPTRP